MKILAAVVEVTSTNLSELIIPKNTELISFKNQALKIFKVSYRFLLYKGAFGPGQFIAVIGFFAFSQQILIILSYVR